MQVGAQQLRDKVAGRCMSRTLFNNHIMPVCTYMSSRGEMKMSLRLMTWGGVSPTHIFP